MAIYAQRTITVSTSINSTASPWIPMDYIGEAPFNVGFGLTFGGDVGVVLARVEHTFDDIQNPSVTPTAFIHTDVSGTNVQIDGNYAFPVRGIRLVVVSAAVTASGSAHAMLTVIQAGG